MAEEETPRQLGPKKRLTKEKAIGVMVTGGVMILLAWFIPIPQDSTLYLGKTVMGVVGFVVICLGSYYRP